MRSLSISDHLQRDDLGHPQTRPIGDAQRRLVLDARRRLQKARDLLGAQNNRHFARLARERQMLDDLGPIERHSEEEPQRRAGAVDGSPRRRRSMPDAAG